MAFLFARGLAERTGCKVGIIEASLGGTGAECWISREGLMKNSVWSRRVEAFDWRVERTYCNGKCVYDCKTGVNAELKGKEITFCR